MIDTRTHRHTGTREQTHRNRHRETHTHTRARTHAHTPPTSPQERYSIRNAGGTKKKLNMCMGVQNKAEPTMVGIKSCACKNVRVHK